ncbi:tRNA lysidine(34) synthetase TilS [Paraburkholderia phymatum]|uniref:tRNA(Ile)-lysidine synthase n=1 Tax=Paraburkholderia phymatum (strain DSM 17167 / CIP 108236 / LMG 21445 / STM815) TaxID=391038 RepID=B2JIR8_PARP8|nr:tRNA lysidine(34) synthetase TilS [Paraburkholderia phymatum]ACC70569.1 tRNA(Ile)-lysidine synthetase [Paraburkholderia phymatum STM815]
MTLSADTSADRLVLDAVGVAFGALPGAARVAIAFSGGVDSSVLLDAAVRVGGAARCLALHVHHGLSPNADAWLAHGEAFARERRVEFASARVDVSRASGASIEAAARDARYRALDALCAQHRVHTLWLAQHADDQAETVLLQLLRGAGLAGLAAMAPEYVPPGAAITRVRPLLRLLRGQLERYARARDLGWIDDESNADTRYARNALRHDVLPALAVHFPGFRDALARTAAHAASAQRLLDELARIDLHTARGEEEGALSRDALLALDDERAANLLRYWMRTLKLPAASTARLMDALRQLREIGGAHTLRVDHAGQALRSYRGQIYWETGDSADPADETALFERTESVLAWRGESVWRLPQWRGTFVFSDAAADASDAIPVDVLTRAPLVARSRSGGERMRCASNGPGRTLKNLFQERGVPSWKRDVPLLFAGDALLFVPLIGVNQAAIAEPSQRRSARYIRIEWREDLTLA